MKILHTSDWHIGRTLYGRKRYEEFEAFLTWLTETIQQNEIDALLVAGDVFDTSAPSNRAQELYYRFLCRVAASPCRHVVVIAGNHDSPSFLNAPKELLKALDVHVIGSSSEALEDEVLVLRNEHGDPELIVCAVPYLRDRDIRVAEAGESVEDKERKLIDGIRTHYAAVAALAEQKREELGVNIPIVAMGHLFTAGG
ncbi:MAG: exonuclease subunit SbcD, partial [Nitrospira sp.]|nr:exonuclease subunit SbcD [Nitrospira sp.]